MAIERCGLVVFGVNNNGSDGNFAGRVQHTAYSVRQKGIADAPPSEFQVDCKSPDQGTGNFGILR